jgi:hypothetical protein
MELAIERFAELELELHAVRTEAMTKAHIVAAAPDLLAALETALVRLIDNVESGSLESTNQAIHEAKQILSA